MPNLKDIQINVDFSSWSGKPIPPAISSLPGIRPTDLDYALLHTALWTRPPKYTGFDLSDCWAWLRYQRSFATTPDLRFRPEWEDLDSHQKTVSSDELGIGFTTQLFADELGFLAYVDTRYMVEVLNPSLLKLLKSTKRGPSKSPDYVVMDSRLLFSVLECKGSQSSVKELANAIHRGIAQKNNIKTRGGSRINYSLVAGLFIPQWTNLAKAVIQISDPEYDELNTFLLESLERNLFIAVVQITLSKHFALMGFYSMANALMNLNITNSNTSRLLNISDKDINHMAKGDNNKYIFSTSLPLPPHKDDSDDIRAKARMINFKMDCSILLIENLIKSNDVLEDLFMIALKLKNQRWEHKDTDTGVELLSPFGFSMRLEYVY